MQPLALILVATLSLWPFLSFASEERDCGTSVNVEQLLKNKNDYDEKMLCVTGLLHIEFEGDELRFRKSTVWLTFYEGPDYTKESIDRDEKRMNNWKEKFQDQCVVVHGRFLLKETGHFGMWPAGIDRIVNITKAKPGACSV